MFRAWSNKLDTKGRKAPTAHSDEGVQAVQDVYKKNLMEIIQSQKFTSGQSTTVFSKRFKVWYSVLYFVYKKCFLICSLEIAISMRNFFLLFITITLCIIRTLKKVDYINSRNAQFNQVLESIRERNKRIRNKKAATNAFLATESKHAQIMDQVSKKESLLDQGQV